LNLKLPGDYRLDTGDLMRKFIQPGVAGAVLLSIGLASLPGARAADLPTKAEKTFAPVWDWTGLYGGIHGGYGWGDADYSFLPMAGLTGFFAPVPGGGRFGQRLDGGMAGGHFGYNQQIGRSLIGLEASFSGSLLNGNSINPFAPAVAPDASYDTDLKWIATLTPRIGFASGNWLTFVKGGLAAGEVRSELTSTALAPARVFQETNRYVGWTVGAGIEYALTNNWIVGAEYNYYDLGSEPYGGRADPRSVVPIGPVQYSTDLRFSTALARLSYKLDGSAPGMASNAMYPAGEMAANGWTGFYAGIHGGYGWGDAGYLFVPFGNAGSFAPTPEGGAFGQSLSNGLAGGHLGFNYQIGRMLTGLEGTLAWTGFSTFTLNAFPGLATGVGGRTYATKMDLLTTITPRLGYTIDNWLIYGKAGLAAGRVESILTVAVEPGPPSILQERTWQVGWTAGLGVEYAITKNWTLGAEYNYYDLGSERYGGRAATNGVPILNVDYRVDVSFSSVLARLSYKFGEPAVVAKY
jgi:outer membrane immunogenic protein